MILALRTDKPEAELYLYDNSKQIDSLLWHAHRELSDTLLIKVDELLERNQSSKQDLRGIVVYQGPGSFTGLRIGISVANTLAYILGIPIAAATNSTWLSDGLKKLHTSHHSHVIVPEYGSEAHITQPRK
jgi:tRNA threonylcarbamoyladenosine biosynthesis protein TsaB